MCETEHLKEQRYEPRVATRQGLTSLAEAGFHAAPRHFSPVGCSAVHAEYSMYNEAKNSIGWVDLFSFSRAG